jgi:hypothetical protein
MVWQRTIEGTSNEGKIEKLKEKAYGSNLMKREQAIRNL